MTVCMFVNAGMWFERFVIIVTSIAQDFLPGAWDFYHPSSVEIWTFVGTFGLFMGLFLLFLEVHLSLQIQRYMEEILKRVGTSP